MKFAFKDENGGSVTYQSNVDISISEDKTSCTLYYVGNSTSELNTKTVEITLIGDRAYKVSKTFDTPRSYEALKRGETALRPSVLPGWIMSKRTPS